ncbi:MAG: hypothetical protein ACOX5R_04900 [bacterium]
MRITVIRLLPVLLHLVVIASLSAQTTDLAVFHNGDFLYGNIRELGNSNLVEIESNGEVQQFKKSMIRQIYMGIQKPTPGDVLTSSATVQASTNYLLSAQGKATQLSVPSLPAEVPVQAITGGLTTRSFLKNREGQEVSLEVEDSFEITWLSISPAQYAFFARQGSYLRAAVRNLTQSPWAGLQLRIFFYGENDHLLTTRDVYVFHLAAAAPDGTSPARSFETELADIPYQLIHRIRFVRKY